MELYTQAYWKAVSEEAGNGLLLCLQGIKISTGSLLCHKCFTYIFSLINSIIFKGEINLLLQMREK